MRTALVEVSDGFHAGSVASYLGGKLTQVYSHVTPSIHMRRPEACVLDVLLRALESIPSSQRRGIDAMKRINRQSGATDGKIGRAAAAFSADSAVLLDSALHSMDDGIAG